MKRLVLTLIAAAVTLLGAVVIAPAGSAGAYPPGQSAVIRVNVSSVRTNETFTVSIQGCIPGETVIFRFRNQTVTTTCSSSGFASASFTPRITPSGFANRSLGAQALPAQAAPVANVPSAGAYQVCGDLTGQGVTVPSGIDRPRTLCTRVEVLAAAGAVTTVPPVLTVPGAGLPATGSSGLGTTTTAAIVVITAGALLLIVAQVRRRRTASA